MKNKFDINLDSAIKEIGAAVRVRRCIPFCGAGVSAESGLPTAKDFLRHLNLKNLEWGEAMSLAQVKQPGFYRHFLKTFGNPALKPNDQHRYLALLDTPVTITTNYDLLLEQAYEEVHPERSHGLGIVSRPQHLPRAAITPNLLIKLHGDVSDEADDQSLLVLTDEHYRQRLHERNPVDDYVRGLFLTYSILFIGHSLSRQEIDIRSILDERNKLNSRYLPDSYILLTDEPEKSADLLLRKLGVKPVYLKGAQRTRHRSCTEFLHRLWEHRAGHAEFIWLHGRSDASLKSALDTALAFKENGRLDEAWNILQSIESKSVNWADEGTLAETFLYLGVALRDKLEMWDQLEVFDRLIATPILRRLEMVWPAKVYGLTWSIYASHMALAMLRFDKIEKAINWIDESLKHRPSPTANAELWLHRANSLVICAMIKITRSIKCKEKIAQLTSAKNNLEVAKSIFERFRGSSSEKGVHHLGRFHGTNAFLLLAQHRIKRSIDAQTIIEHAERAHKGERRTRFGRIAGMYCEAACRYYLSSSSSPPESDDNWIRAYQLAENAIGLLSGSEHSTVSLKLHILYRRLEKKISALAPMEKVLLDQAKIAEWTTKHPFLCDLIEKVDWLWSPLN